MKIGLEHVNVTTRDPQAAAEWLGRVFGWRIRWQGSALETRVRAEGFETYSHDDYEPGRRFYFLDNTGFEFEVVSYS